MRIIVKLLLAVFFVSCASVNTKLPKPDKNLVLAEEELQAKQAFERLLAQQKRLNDIGIKILQANAELCKKTNIDFGITTHSLQSYPKHVRPLAAKYLGATDTDKILFVRNNSAAAKSGIKPGDILLDEKNKPTGMEDLKIGADGKLKIKRGDETKTITVKGVPVCASRLRLKPSSAINAYANGKDIFITTAMIDFASDKELALVIGHELAHNTMGHVKKAIWNTIVSGLASRTTRPFEAEADYVGLYYMARAGYDIDGVEEIWRRLGVLFPKNIARAKTHPVTPERLLAIRMTAKEIKSKQKEGKPLTPNLKKPAK